MKFNLNDGGKSVSLRPKQRRDCCVRAIAITRGWQYDEAHNVLASLGRETGKGTPKKIWKSVLKGFERLSFPAQAGLARMNLETFCEEFPSGRFIVQMAGHLTAVIDGTVNDAFEPRNKGCVYAAWKI